MKNLSNLSDASPGPNLGKNEQFMRVLAHDLRNILGAVSMSTEVLNSRAKDALEKSALDVLLRQVARLQGIIGTALEVAKAIDGQLILSLRRVDLHVMLRQLQVGIDNVAESEPAAAAELWIDVDPGYFVPAVQMLLNAVRGDELDEADAMGNVIQISMDTSAVRLSVGAAMPAQAIHATTTDPNLAKDEQLSKFGLEVLLAQKILELHGGSLSYGPAEGKSGFTLAMPFH